MPYLLENLVIDRVDLVDEGANSAAFIEVFKRKEQSNLMNISEILEKMKPEHAAVIQQELDALRETAETTQSSLDDVTKRLDDANEALAKANEELENLKAEDNDNDTCECDGEADDDGNCKECGKPKKTASFDETNVLKSMPEAVRDAYLKMRAQKEAAEEQVRKAAEDKAHADAVAKAATLKALPVEQDKLVEILKRCDSDVVDILGAVAEAIDGVVLGEVGKSKKTEASMTAWDKIESEADKIVESDNVTKQKAITMVIKRNPELYTEYLNGGAK